MAKNLLIVESPAKAKTIEKILGSDFIVKSSYGHIRDLSKDSKDKKAIDVENGYKLHYEVSKEKNNVVKELKSYVKKVDEVWLATDEDREGEAISWHLAQVLGLKVNKTKRIAFREITKPALKKAIEEPRLIDMDVVNAQQARRVLDRLVGFELSGLLWRKIRGKLSAGRVQSVAVKLVVERERQINEFVPTSFYATQAIFEVEHKGGRKVKLKANLSHKFEDVAKVEALLESCKGGEFSVNDIHVRPGYRKPAAPFTTSTLQQEASRKLGFSVSRTMSVAQKLYEAGHITYMRTDSTTMSEVALKAIASEIVSSYGDEYLKTRQYKSKKSSAQEAHEAIRPTYVQKVNVSEQRDEQRLYELIRKRTMASQMADAKLEKTTIKIKNSAVVEQDFLAEGETVKFDGFLKLYLESKDEEDDQVDDGILPPMSVGEVLDLHILVARERFTKPVARFTEASLVKKLEELEIGRPSTYAPTISKIMDPSRGYVEKQIREGKERTVQVLLLDGVELRKKGIASVEKTVETECYGATKNKLFASDLGMQVTDFLSKYFKEIMDYSFTAGIEQRLDEVSEGKKDWVKMVDKVYQPFHSIVEDTKEHADRVTGERILGKDPESGMTVLVRIGRYGPVAQIGTPEELGEEKPKYANVKKEQSIETITLEEALELFSFPKDLGEYDGEAIIIGEGRFGPYVKFEGKFISIPRGEDPFSVNLNRAIELIEERRKADAPIGHYKDLPITKGVGRFGPFVKWDKFFVSITKGSGFLIDTITEEQAIILIKAKEEKEANRYIHRWDDYGITVENGRWGPFIKMGKKNFKIPAKSEKRATQEEAKELTFEQVKALILDQGGEVKEKKKKKATKKKATKKTTKKK